MRYLGAQDAPKEIATQDQLVDATPTQRGLMPATDKAKLNGVQSGATANSPDATLLNRANHTGTQTLATISDAGSAAARNVQANSVDVSASVVLTPGAYGWGSIAPVVVTDIDTVRPNQIVRVGAGDPGNPNQGVGTSIITLAEGGSYGSQLAMAAGGSPGSLPLKHRIRSSASAWGPWVPYWNELTLQKQVSALDATPGRVMLTSSFGWGGKIPLVYNSTNQFYLTDYAQYVDSGIYLGTGDGTSSPSANGPPGSGNNALLSLALSANGATQWLAINNSGSPGGKNLFIGNYFGNSAAMAWARCWHSGNFNPADYSTTAQMQAAIVAGTTGSPVITISTTTRTMALSDWASGAPYALFTNTSASTLTVPANSSAAIPIGAEFHISREANANLTIVAASGVLVKPQAGGTLVMTENMRATLKKVGINTWHLIGQAVAA